MRTKTVKYYYCDYCNNKYSTKAAVLKCECKHTRETTDPNGSKPKYRTGDFVYEILGGGHRWHFVLSEDWESYWDAEKKCWMYKYQRGIHTTSIAESKLRLVMKASKYKRRVKDIEDKLGGDYFVDICPYHDKVGFRVDLELKGDQND